MANEVDSKTKWQELKADPVRYAFHLEKQRQHYAKNREKERARGAAKYQRDKEYYKKKHAEWWEAHPDKSKEYGQKKYAEHPERERARSQKWHEENREYVNAKAKEYREGPQREQFLKALIRSQHRTHLTAEQIDTLWDRSRNGPCEICGLTGEVMHLDHDHKTNTYRGLLCNNCNAGIGFLQDDTAILVKAIEYLTKVTG